MSQSTYKFGPRRSRGSQAYSLRHSFLLRALCVRFFIMPSTGSAWSLPCSGTPATREGPCSFARGMMKKPLFESHNISKIIIYLIVIEKKSLSTYYIPNALYKMI